VPGPSSGGCRLEGPEVLAGVPIGDAGVASLSRGKCSVIQPMRAVTNICWAQQAREPTAYRNAAWDLHRRDQSPGQSDGQKKNPTVASGDQSEPENSGLPLLNLASALWLPINPDAGAPQSGFAMRIKVALPSAIFIDRKLVALAGLIERQ